MEVAKRSYRSCLEDNLLSRAAELGYFFLFAIFPMLLSATAILGLVARGATAIYSHLLEYLAIVIPHSSLATILVTFKETTNAATGGKITLELAAALWSASVGFSAIQDTLNIVYKVKESRPYWKARGSAILVSVLLSVIATTCLAALLGGDFLARFARMHLSDSMGGIAAAIAARTLAWLIAAALLILLFAVIYYFGPNVRSKKWHWLSSGAAIGILGWFTASLGLRIYLHYFDQYSLTYGSLGAVIILVLWFYITGLMLLAGAEVNSEIAAAVIEKRLDGNASAEIHPFPDAFRDSMQPALVTYEDNAPFSGRLLHLPQPCSPYFRCAAPGTSHAPSNAPVSGQMQRAADRPHFSPRRPPNLRCGAGIAVMVSAFALATARHTPPLSCRRVEEHLL